MSSVQHIAPSFLAAGIVPHVTGFPSAIARIGGLPVSSVRQLASPALLVHLELVASLDTALIESRDHISAELYALVSQTGDRRQRARVIELRRHLYREQLPTSWRDTLASFPDSPSAEAARHAVTRVARLIDARTAALAALGVEYHQELIRVRGLLQEGVADADFAKGVLLSSRSLFLNLARYRNTPAAHMSGRHEQIERGLLRYFTRTAMKATPFARFCAISLGKFDAPSHPASRTEMRFAGDPSIRRGFVRLNKALYATFWSHLKSRPAVRLSLTVALNPTLSMDGTRLLFLATIGGHEVFQRMEHVGPVEATIRLVRTKPGLTLGEVAHALAAHAEGDSAHADAVAFIEALLGCGLLQFRAFVPEQTAEWDLPLREALEGIDDDHARLIATLLRDVRLQVQRYTTATVAERHSLADAIRDQLLATMHELGTEQKIPRDLPLFEDAATPAQLEICCGEDMQEAFALLDQWIAFTRPLHSVVAKQATMRAVFDRLYDGVEHVPLLSFYEAFYRTHFKAHLEAVARKRRQPDDTYEPYDVTNPLGLGHVNELHAAHGRLKELVRERWRASPTAHTIDVTPDEVRQALGTMAAPPQRVPQSASAFCQSVVGGQEGASLVLNGGQYFVGFGKYFSRFLYMLPNAFQEELYERNVTIAGGAMLAEICGDGQFNANLHPALLPWEISYPTGEGATSSAQLPSAELDVVRDPDCPFALSLRHRPTRARVIPVDLGFLNPRLRPPLYQLLIDFMPGSSFRAVLPETDLTPTRSAASPTRTVRSATPNPPDTSEPPVAPEPAVPAVVYRPRITFGRRLVLARRRWTVPASETPTIAPGESDVAFLRRVDRWRRTHGIPTEVYVRVAPLPAARASSPARGSSSTPRDNATRDDVGSDGRTRNEGPHGATVSSNVEEDEISLDDTPLDDDASLDENIEPFEITVAHATNRVTPIQASGARHTATNGVATHARKASGSSRDWYKPQFIDFTSPLLVKLFAHLAGGLRNFRLELEESYPAPDALPAHGDERYAFELVIQRDVMSETNDTTVAAVRASHDY